MGTRLGQKLWHRERFEVPAVGAKPGEHTVDTGIKQPNTGFGDYSPGEPALEADGPVGSRIQVIPMAGGDGLANWTQIRHGEPFVDGGTIHVTFYNDGPLVTVNCFFWDPHSMVGPGDADRYTVL
jgi:hypothetical protein